MLLKNANILMDDFTFVQGDLRVTDGKIAGIGELVPCGDEEVRDLEGRYLIPGLIETHFHGAMGESADFANDTMLPTFSNFEVTRGITTFVPGPGSAPDEVTERFLEKAVDFASKPYPGAKMCGVYLEGPFISHERKGGHSAELLQLPSAEKLRRWQEKSGGLIKKTIVAPELEGAEEFVRTGVELGIVVEIGHSIATYEQAITSFDWGITLATHTYNGMNPLNHRNPGVLGAVLTDPRVTSELICDFGHVAPAAVKLCILAKGYDKINVISDSMMAAGLGDGVYVGGDGHKTIVENGLSKNEEGTITGSACTIMEGMRNLVSIGIPLEMAVKMCSYNPARMLRIDHETGSIACGKWADLVALNRDLSIEAVWVDGVQKV